jgi:hypothetical protein
MQHHTTLRTPAFVSLLLLILVSHPVQAQFSLFPTPPSAKVDTARVVLMVALHTEPASAQTPAAQSAILDDGSSFSRNRTSRSRCGLTPPEAIQRLRSALTAEALRPLLQEARVRGCFNPEAIAAPSLVIHDGIAIYVFSLRALPNAIRVFVRLFDEVVSSTGCHPQATPLAPLL